MEATSIVCKGCGAPLHFDENAATIICDYCGHELVIESLALSSVGKKLASAVKEGAGSTQLELRRLQLTQELAILQMQLSNLRSEKRNIQRENDKRNKRHLVQIEQEERQLVEKINSIGRELNPNPQAGSSARDQADNTGTAAIGKYGAERGIVPPRSWGNTLALALLLGWFGAHRFYTGRVKTGIIQLLTLGGFGIWWLIDIIMVLTDAYKDSLGRPLDKSKRVNGFLKYLTIGFYTFAFLAQTGDASVAFFGTLLVLLGVRFFRPALRLLKNKHQEHQAI